MKNIVKHLAAIFLSAAFIVISGLQSFAANLNKPVRVQISIHEENPDEVISFAQISIIKNNIEKPFMIADLSGQASLELEDSLLIKVSSMGYTSKQITLYRNPETVSVTLSKGILLKPVVISAEYISLIHSRSRCGYITRTCDLNSENDEESNGVISLFHCFFSCRIISIPGILTEEKSDIKSEKLILSAYPNPAANKCRFKTEIPAYTIELFDMNGSLILKILNFSDESELNVEELKPGNYIARLTSGENILKTKLVIAR